MLHKVKRRPVAPMTRRPSWAWAGGAVLAAVIATLAVLSGIQFQRAADQPVGEGELFAIESTTARQQIEAFRKDGVGMQDAIRRVRNGLNLETVAVVDSSGRVLASTSPNMEGNNLNNGLLIFGLESRYMAAVAAAVDEPILIDGVVERPAGEIVYQVVQPLEGGGGLLLYYDISDLFERRAREQGIRTLTVQLLGVGAFFIIVAVILIIGRSLVARDLREMAFEAELLRRQSTELEEYNRELAAARAEAEQALALAEEKNRIRAEFVLMINHELRTPLTTVVTGAELLNANGALTDDERTHLLRHMVSDGRRLQEMIGQMLTVARIENRGLNFTLRDISVTEVMDDLEPKHPRLEVDRSSSDQEPNPMRMRTDPTTLSQLISSLADNALTHGAKRVTLRSSSYLPFEPLWEVGHRPAEAVYLLVEDDGPGIDPAFLPRAFEKFEKDSNSSGTGLGLYMARMMVEALNGSLSVDTSKRGTTMAVAIPLSRVRMPAGVGL